MYSELVPPSSAAHTEREVASRLTFAYVVGLAVIAALAILTHVLLDNAIAKGRDASTIINIAGRQRMLSQRIALFANDLHAGDAGARPPLLEAIALMERSEEALTHGGDLGISQPLSPQAREYYFEGPAALDPLVRGFLANARRFAATPGEAGAEDAYKALQIAAHDTFLSALDRAVSIFEQEASQRIEWLLTAQNLVLATLLTTLALEAAFIFRPLVRKMRLYARQLYEMATRDTLTGLLNRSQFLDVASRELLIASRTTAPISALIIDLDHFRRVNDGHGQTVGDEVLKRLASIAAEQLRERDLFARLGGEEFAVLLPETDLSEALTVAETLRHAVANDRTKGVPPFTVSVGVSTLEEKSEAVDDLLRKANEALEKAKRDGRNRVAA